MSIYKSKLTEDWCNIKEIYVYGLGDVATCCLPELKKNFDILAIVDKKFFNYKSKVENIDVISPEELMKKRTNQKIVIMTGGRVYLEIAKELENVGLIENMDFCAVERFITEWFWKYSRKNCQMEIHMAVTLRCTLRCKNCNMFIPYQHATHDFDLKNLEMNVDNFFHYVDYVYRFVLLGGEPLLHSGLKDLIHYIGEKYSEKIGKIVIITNGTIVPDEQLLRILAEQNVEMKISDYTDQVAYKDKIVMLIKSLKKFEIPYMVNREMKWNDFGFPENPVSYTESNVREHMIQCGPICHGLNDGKFFFCHVAWGADQTGRFQLKKDDFVELNDIRINEEKIKREIAAHSMAEFDAQAVSLCKICGGCGIDNRNVVDAGLQCKKSNKTI